MSDIETYRHDGVIPGENERNGDGEESEVEIDKIPRRERHSKVFLCWATLGTTRKHYTQ